MRWHDGMGTGNWLVMSLMVLLFVAVTIAVLILVTRGRNDGYPHNVSRADVILDERLARGEITVSEYREARAQLAAR